MVRGNFIASRSAELIALEVGRTWRPDGTWSGADGVLGFADGLTPCDGAAREGPEMWRETLAGGLSKAAPGL